MTVSASGRSKTYLIAAGVTGYGVPFPVIAASDLLVYLHLSLTFDPDAPGVALTEGVHYALAGNASAGSATVVPLPAFPASGYLTLYRVTSMAQTAAYTPNDGFPAKTHEAQLDRLSLVDQEQQQSLDDTRARALLAKPGQELGPIDTAVLAGAFLGFDAAGHPVPLTGTGADVGLRRDLASRAAGAALVAYSGNTVEQKLGENVSVKDFGAKGDGVTNDSPAIQAAIDHVAALGGGTVRVPAGRYALGMRFIPAPYFGFFALEMKTGVRLEGEDEYRTYLRIMDNIPGVGPGAPFVAILGQTQMQNVTVCNLTIDGNRQAQPGLDPSLPNNQPPSNGGTILIGSYDSQPLSNIRIERVRSLNAFGQGIQVFGQNSQIGRNVRVHQCDVIGPGYIGIQVSRCSSVSITDNNLEGTGDNAIDIYGDSGAVESVQLNTIIRGNRMTGCLRGIFPETTMFCLVQGNTIDGSDEGIHCNQIVSAPHSMIIDGNSIRRTRAPMVFSGAFNTVLVTHNIIIEYTYAAFTIGFTSGQVSGVIFDRNVVWPTNNAVPIFLIPPGTVFASLLKFGTTYLTERDAAHPTPTNLYLSGFAQYQNLSSYPAVLSITNPGPDKPEAFIDYAYLNQPKLGNIPVAASNADATSKGMAVNTVYRTATGQLNVVF